MIPLRTLSERQNHRCCYCGTHFSDARPDPAEPTYDHVVPRAMGGGDADDNLVAACWRCNAARGTRDAHEFYEHVASGGEVPPLVPGGYRDGRALDDDARENLRRLDAVPGGHRQTVWRCLGALNEARRGAGMPPIPARMLLPAFFDAYDGADCGDAFHAMVAACAPHHPVSLSGR